MNVMIMRIALAMKNDQIVNYVLIQFVLNAMKIIIYLKIYAILNVLKVR